MRPSEQTDLSNESAPLEDKLISGDVQGGNTPAMQPHQTIITIALDIKQDNDFLPRAKGPGPKTVGFFLLP
jgi:hypothetical protein